MQSNGPGTILVAWQFGEVQLWNWTISIPEHISCVCELLCLQAEMEIDPQPKKAPEWSAWTSLPAEIWWDHVFLEISYGAGPLLRQQDDGCRRELLGFLVEGRRYERLGHPIPKTLQSFQPVDQSHQRKLSYSAFFWGLILGVGPFLNPRVLGVANDWCAFRLREESASCPPLWERPRAICPDQSIWEDLVAFYSLEISFWSCICRTLNK